MKPMNMRSKGVWRVLAVLVVAAALGGQSLHTLLLAQAAQPAQAVEVQADGGWPRAYETATKARLLIYQPQIASWEGQRHMVAYAAAGYEAPGAARPVLGSVKVESTTSVSLEERLVQVFSGEGHRNELPDAQP